MLENRYVFERVQVLLLSMKRVLLLILLAAILLLFISLWVAREGQKAIVDSLDKLEPAQAAIILGAGVYPDGRVSVVLADRLKTGVELYRAGKVKKLLLTGDHGRTDYDEVNTMRRYVESLGVPARDIFMDHAGFSTYDSMYRAREVFGVTDAVVVTQRFHLPRALYTAKQLGIRAVGLAADKTWYQGEQFLEAREALARCKAFFQIHILRSGPKYLGPAIPISGDGRATWDQEK